MENYKFFDIPVCDLTNKQFFNLKKTHTFFRKREKSNQDLKKKNKLKSDFKNTMMKKAYIKDESHQDNGMSEFEKMVQKNREERMAFLEKLNIDEVSRSFCAAVQDLKPKRRLANIKRPSFASSSPPILRKSSRLAKKDIDLSEEAVIRRALEETKFENLKEIIEELPPTLEFEKALKSKGIFSKFIEDISVLKGKATEQVKAWSSHFESMKINESQIAKVSPVRITAMDIHPVCDKIIIAAADKYGHVSFWNMNSDSTPSVFLPHTQGVTDLKFNRYDSNKIVSSSYDGTLRSGDIEKLIFDEVHKESNRVCCTYFDLLSKTTFIIAHKDGNVAVVDNRASKKSVTKIHRCHDYTVKSVSVHPVNQNYFISSEIKGTIKLWDLRKLQQRPVVDLSHHKKSVTSAFFSPVTGNSILSTSTDDSLCIFDSSKLGKDISLKRSIKHNNFTGRWLSLFRAKWLPNTDDTFVVGSMLYPRRIEIYNDNGNNIYNFMHDDLSSITSVHAFHPNLPVLAGGNSSGKVFVFTDST